MSPVMWDNEMRKSKRKTADSSGINTLPLAPCGRMEGGRKGRNDRNGTEIRGLAVEKK